MGIYDFLLIAAGGAIGSIIRGILSAFLIGLSPWPTLVANLIGAFLIGILVKLMDNSMNPESFRAFWIIGLCGGFTTFSAFGMEMVGFIKASQWGLCIGYAFVSVIGSITAIFAGFRLYSYFQA